MIMSIFKCVLTLFWTLPSKLKWVKHYWIFSKKVYHTFSGLRTFTSFFSQWHPCGIFFLSLNQEVLIYSFPRSDQGGQSLKSSPPMEQPPFHPHPKSILTVAQRESVTDFDTRRRQSLPSLAGINFQTSNLVSSAHSPSPIRMKKSKWPLWD